MEMLLQTVVLSLLLSADGQPQVFDQTARPAPLEARIKEAGPGPLRVLTVEERLGCARRQELVRVPLFFHEGECTDIDGFRLIAVGDDRQTAIPYQADDIRRDTAGRISRAHLYFLTDLQPWQRRQYHLIQGRNPGAQLPPVPLRVQGDQVMLAGEDLSVAFMAKGPRAGAIVAVQSTLGKITLLDGMLAPRLSLVRQAEDLKVVRSTPISYQRPESQEVRSVRFGSGPLFAKLVVVSGPPRTPDRVEFTYLVPRHGHLLIQSERLFPAENDAVQTVGAAAADHVLLGGKLVLGADAADQKVLRVPAGLRRLTRSVHGHTNEALVNAKDRLSLLPIPYTQTGVTGVHLGEDGVVDVKGPAGFRREGGSNSHTLKAFWGEVRFVLSRAVTEEELWEEGRRHFQPLVAIVDEPILTADDVHAVMPTIAQRFFEIKQWGRGWPQTAAMHYLSRDEGAFQKLMAKIPSEKETQVTHYLPAWAIKGEPPPATVKKDVGRIDPYHISYANSSIVPLALYPTPSERLDAVSLAIGRFSRQVNGQKEQFGFPYIDCFATALNMQVGSYLLGLHGGKKAGDLDLVQFYRDCARTPAVQGLYGHGQRPYPGTIRGPGPSDLLYESTSDFQFRILEVYGQENLELHPMVFGRYFDCVDVTADLYHRPTDQRPSWHRANFWRGQAHDHRWEAWDCAPYMGLFARADDEGRVGATEAVSFLRYVSQRHINWSELMWFFHADVLLKHAQAGYQPPALPALPQDLQVRVGKSGNVLSWKPVPAALGYRVYRADRMGGPWVFVNSPYTAKPGALVRETTFTDADGKEGQIYFVTALDADRRESRWFADEPLPRPGKKPVRSE